MTVTKMDSCKFENMLTPLCNILRQVIIFINKSSPSTYKVVPISACFLTVCFCSTFLTLNNWEKKGNYCGLFSWHLAAISFLQQHLHVCACSRFVQYRLWSHLTAPHLIADTDQMRFEVWV